ncbi:MAG: hypothetical protein QOG43_2232 [Actinomycetota bacterium]|jgi:DNA-directed RNA polymerase specialized sigma24 family protein|nr:hypothetical protein [Actinomycetota bacterium]
MDDATLVSRAVGGDREAFAAVYDRYAGAVFDLCTAILRNPEDAADATLDSFLRAARELVNLQDRSRLRPWLLAVARHEATSRAERRQDEGRHEDGLQSPAGGGEVPEWDPAEALSEGDRAVLHLHLRHQLDGEELGAVVGMRPAVAEARAARLRTMAETSVGALLLSRRDPTGDGPPCAGLAEILEGWDGRFNPSIGVRINRHARGCEACQARRTMLLERLQAMATLPFAPPPSWLRPEVLLRMELAVSSRTLPGWGEDGFPPGVGTGGGRGGRGGRTPRRRPRRSTVLAGGAAVLVLAVAGVLLVSHDWDGGSTVSASVAPTTRAPASTLVAPPTTVRPPVTTAATPTTAATATTGPAAPGPPAGSVDTTTPAPAPPPPPAADRDPPEISFGADAASAYVYGCPYSRTGVSADVSDRSQVVWVALFVRRPDGVEESVNMSPDGGRWRATMGDFDTPGQAVFWVEAIDSEGNRAVAPSQVLDVLLCE